VNTSQLARIGRWLLVVETIPFLLKNSHYKMKTLFTKTNANFGCYGKNSDVVKAHTGDIFTIEDVLNSDVPLKDKAWFIRRNCEFTIDEFRQFAIGCALCVLPIYEYKYPKDKVPREAIEAAQAYLKNEISIDELYTKRHAAAAAAYARGDSGISRRKPLRISGVCNQLSPDPNQAPT